METRVPEGKFRRGVIGGVAAAKVGGRFAGYFVKRPFLSDAARSLARKKLDQTNARAVFACLSLLKGTALKIAQLLSMELELFPEAIRTELEKSYSQVPPMNRALVRRAALNALGRPPEEVFAAFDSQAFAAASLGQVHEAAAPDGTALAVKVQYPGIHRAIEDDMQLVKGLLRPLPDYGLIAPAIDEIAARLREETDYEREAVAMSFFRENLHVEGVHAPRPWAPGTRQRILACTRLSGLPLDQWLATGPSDDAKDVVAERLNQVFLQSFYGLRRIHADPNPGNFIIDADLGVGLVDFGCVKSFDAGFVERYRQLPRLIIHGNRQEYFQALQEMRLVQGKLEPEVARAIYETAYEVGRWLGRLYEPERFDFSRETGFMAEGREISKKMFQYRRHFTMNPDFVFLDRTRYGLLRVFQKMRCRVRLRNAYEWDSD